MSDLTNRVIQLREEGILRKWTGEQQHEALEMMLAFYEQHKKQTGTYKYIIDSEEYHNKMKERLDWVWGKTMKYMENYKE